MLVLALMSLTYNKIDTPMLALMRTSAEAGTYWAAYTIVFALAGFGAVLAKAALPEMSRAHHAGTSSSANVALLSGLAAAGGLAGALAVIGSAGVVMGRLYGAEFVEGAQALTLLAWAVPMTVTSGVLLNHAVATGRQRGIAVGAIAAASLNIGANLVLIPRYGVRGAAIATLLSEAVLVLTGLVALLEVARRRQLVGRLVWIGVPAVLCATLIPSLTSAKGPALSVLLVCAFTLAVSPQLFLMWRQARQLRRIVE